MISLASGPRMTRLRMTTTKVDAESVEVPRPFR